MLVMVVFFIAFRWIHLSTPLIRLFLLVMILHLMPTLNCLPVWFALSLLRFRLPSRLPMMFILWMVFFFSSRRRHTRLQGDWSSDVCSSDLLRTTLNWDLARMRSNSLSTRGCGERMQTVSFVEVRFVVTVRQIIENWPKGQVLWCVCSRIVTDSYDAGPRGTSFNRISTMRFAA